MLWKDLISIEKFDFNGLFRLVYSMRCPRKLRGYFFGLQWDFGSCWGDGLLILLQTGNNFTTYI